MKLLFILIMFYLFIYTNLSAQDFGDIPDELLSQTIFNEDPEADAIIIFDIAEIKITRDFNLEYKRHVRLKILTEEGKNYSNIKISYWHEDKIFDLEAIAVSPDGKETELDDDNIFEEESGKIKNLSFAVPGVEIGSVIDYQYQRYSEYITFLEPWYFQDEIYTKLSHLSVILPPGFTYTRLAMNTEPYNFEEKNEEILDSYSSGKKLSKFSWKCTKIPGIKEEPFTDNIEDNYAKVYFILQSYKDAYTDFQLSESWDQVAERIYKFYDNRLNQDGETEEVIKQMNLDGMTPLDKAKKIFKYVRDNIKTTPQTTLLATDFKFPDDLLDQKEGSASEKNVLLINLLRHAGLDGRPVLISTRSNGIFISGFHDYSQFNRLICALYINPNYYFLYTGSESIPFGFLVPEYNVAEGLMIQEDKGTVIKLKPFNTLNKTTISTNAILYENGSLKGTTKIIYTGLSAWNERENLNEKEHQKYLEDLIKNLHAEAHLDTFYYSSLDSVENPLSLSLEYTIENYIEESEPFVYLSLPLFSAIDENPFKRERRLYPVEYDFEQIISEELKVNYPSNYTLEEFPNVRRSISNDFGFSQVYSNNEGSFECKSNFTLKNRKITPINYKKLKDMYSDMAAAKKDMVVFKK